MNYAILTTIRNDGPHWNKCKDENRVFVWVTRYRDYADVSYDTFSRRPGDRDRLTEQGLGRLCKTFVSHGSRAFHCGDTSGETTKRIPLEHAKSLAGALCDLFTDDSLFASEKSPDPVAGSSTDAPPLWP
ncbi:MAG TPA: hypothetical protein VJ810_23685 [Blastocatellia bacterium]|nr:hypothetical protein [Blastocatellia bacterium]